MSETGAQSDKPHFAGGPWHPAEWVVPLGVSCCLHLLLIGALAVWDRHPPEIVWVSLIEARLLTTKEQPQLSRPPAAPPLPQQPAPARHTEQPREVKAVSPEPAMTASPSALPLTPGEEMTGSMPAAAMANTDLSPTAPSSAVSVATEPLPEPAETGAQSYLRAQFAYIRERVMARLVYPPLARRQGLTGQVQVEFIIRADGSIDGVRVAASSGRALLDQQAVRAVQAAAPFPPPPAPAMITLPVLFTVESAQY